VLHVDRVHAGTSQSLLLAQPAGGEHGEARVFRPGVHADLNTRDHTFRDHTVFQSDDKRGVTMHDRSARRQQLAGTSGWAGLEWLAVLVKDKHDWMGCASGKARVYRYGLSRAGVTPLPRYRGNGLPSPMLHAGYHTRPGVVSWPRFGPTRRSVCWPRFKRSGLRKHLDVGRLTCIQRSNPLSRFPWAGHPCPLSPDSGFAREPGPSGRVGD